MIRTKCLLLALGLALPGLQAEIHKKSDTVAAQTAHKVKAAGQGAKAGAQKSGEAVTGAARETAHGTVTATKAVGNGVVSGAKGVVHAAGKGLEKTGGALTKAGE
jgi:hypothetical protein